MKTILRTFLWVIALFVLALAADQIGPLKQFSRFLAEHPQPYSTITIVLAVAGWVLLGGAFALGLKARGHAMSEDEARRFARLGRSIGLFSGRAAGTEFEMEMTFRDYKEVIRSGSALRNVNWLIFTLGLAGAALAIYGMFGYFFVIGPPLVKLLCGGALLYATLRTGWSFWKA